VSLVLDSSITLAWLYREGATKPIDEIFENLIEASAWVPALWHLEVANVLQIGIRRKRHGEYFRDRILSDLSDFPIHVDPETHRQAWGVTSRLAERHQLTLYDAAYLELALRRGLPLATLDDDLGRAAANEGVQLLGARK
jgi:predicted nucleic acid-binding protein